jgi:hypothetical protein
MLRALEARVLARGSPRCTLTSTETALQFYKSNGYAADGRPVGHFGTSSGYPMSKMLVGPSSQEVQLSALPDFGSVLIVCKRLKATLEHLEGISDDEQASVEIRITFVDPAPRFVLRALEKVESRTAAERHSPRPCLITLAP